MVKSNSPSSILHPLSFLSQRQLSLPFFLHIVPDIYSAFTNMYVWLVRGGGAYYTNCTAPGFCCFAAYLGDLSIYLFLQSCSFLLKGCLIAACKSSTGDYNVQPGLGATDRVLKEFRESFLKMIIL